jgi:hypothetical protein
MQDKKTQEEIYNLNFKVLSQEPSLRSIERILGNVDYAVLARYDEESKHWNYLKVKGPMFLVKDKYNQRKLAILNHLSANNHVISINSGIKLELKKIEYGYMLNYLYEDTITGRSIYGIWSADERLK